MESVRTYGILNRKRTFLWLVLGTVLYWVFMIALSAGRNQDFNFLTFLLSKGGLLLWSVSIWVLAWPFLSRFEKLEVGEDFVTWRNAFTKHTIHAKDVSSIGYGSRLIFGKGLWVTLAINNKNTFFERKVIREPGARARAPRSGVTFLITRAVLQRLHNACFGHNHS